MGGPTTTKAITKSSTPKVPADPVSFDANRRQNTRTAKKLNKTPTTKTLFVLSLGITPQAFLVNFSVAIQSEKLYGEAEAGELLKASRIVQFWLIHSVILLPNSAFLQMQAVSVSEHVEFKVCSSMQRSCPQLELFIESIEQYLLRTQQAGQHLQLWKQSAGLPPRV